MLFTALLSFVAGLLTAFAPCVLPLLPIMLGGSLDAQSNDKKRPYIITVSLVISLIFFTIILKASTVLIGVDPRVWTIGSGMLVIALGTFMLFPNLWAKIISYIHLENASQGLLNKAFFNKNRTLSAILTGAALGPVFSSCSPTYAWVIATVLPSNVITGIIYLCIYCVGVATSLLAIALLGRKFLQKVTWASNPKGWFQRGIAVLFIVVGIFVATGLDKQVQTYLVDKDIFNLIELEQGLVPENSNSNNTKSESSLLNVDAYPAADFSDIADWLNSSPLTVSELKGKVVLIDFWTYSCINCIRTQPYLNAWYDEYNDNEFTIIGVHAPEFSFEKKIENVQRAITDAGIKYPVALDNSFSTWNAYNNRFWPAKYLIDKEGNVRYTHFGEGNYNETERAIQQLLGEEKETVSTTLNTQAAPRTSKGDQTPETYLGYDRGERFANARGFEADTPKNYVFDQELESHQWSLGGPWQIGNESSTSTEDGAQLAIKYSAKTVYLVMSGPNGLDVEISTGANKKASMKIDTSRLYTVVTNSDFIKDDVLLLTFPKDVTIHAFTFGS